MSQPVAVLPDGIPAGFTETRKIGRKPHTAINTLSVLMPIYNERQSLEIIVRRVLSAQTGLELELIAVDDGSTDGSRELLRALAAEDSRIVAIEHDRNRGKGAAIRTAIARCQGDVAVIQDADLEYDPQDFARLLGPILSGQADAVFGSRFRGEVRRILFFWHSVLNGVLTMLCNMVNDLNLTDMETCYKMVRTDTLKNLRIASNTFNIEPELTARLKQWGARIYEVPINYSGRTYLEGKKIGLRDAFKAVWEIFRSGIWDRRFTDHDGFYILTSVATATRYNHLVLKKVDRYLGRRVMEAGAGIGNMSQFLLHRERLVLVDYEPLYISRLMDRFGALKNVQIGQADLTQPGDLAGWKAERLDTIFCSNVIEHIENDEQVLQNFHDLLEPGGHAIIVVPAVPGLYSGVDAALGHYRRYTSQELAARMRSAGFEIVHTDQFNKLGSMGWFLSGKVLRRKSLSPGQMRWFDRMLWLAKIVEYVPGIPGMSLIMVGRKR